MGGEAIPSRAAGLGPQDVTWSVSGDSGAHGPGSRDVIRLHALEPSGRRGTWFALQVSGPDSGPRSGIFAPGRRSKSNSSCFRAEALLSVQLSQKSSPAGLIPARVSQTRKRSLTARMR